MPKITKLIPTKLDIEPEYMYRKDLNETILSLLERKFQGRCFKKCLITKIIGLEKRSDCVMSKSSLGGVGSVDVIFKVEGITYNRKEVIHGCEIIQIIKTESKHKIVCKGDISTIYVASHSLLHSLNVGQIIPVTVEKVQYTPGIENISVVAYPLNNISDEFIYRVDEDVNFTDEENQILESYKEQIKEEEELKKKLDTKRWDYFNKLVFPYKKEEKLVGEKMMDISDYKFLSNNYVTRRRMDRSKQQVKVLKSVKNDLEKFVKSETAFNVAQYMLLDYLEHLRNIRGMCETYKTDKIFNDHKNLWKIYEDLKNINK